MRLLLCYAPEDSESLAKRLEIELAKLPNLTLWLNELDQLMACDWLVVIFSPALHPQHRLWITIEAALAEKVTVIPLLTGGVGLPAVLADQHTLDLNQNLEAGLRKFIAEMRNRTGLADGDTAPLNPDHMTDKVAYLDATEPIRTIPNEDEGGMPVTVAILLSFAFGCGGLGLLFWFLNA